jgi:DNA-binding transcriptional LysR family regulator
MELRQLKTFQTIANLNSFYRAADALGYAQSTVSEQIKALETDLKVNLFERNGRQVSLTPAGEKLLEYTQKMLFLENEIKSEIYRTREIRGTLALRVPETLGVHYFPPVIQAFYTRYPRVNLQFKDCAYFGVVEELRAGIVQLVFLLIHDFHAPGIKVEKLLAIPLALVSHPKRQGQNGLEAVKNEPVLIPGNDCSYVQDLERFLTEQKVAPSQVWHFNSLEAIKRTLLDGIGVSVLPEITIRAELASGQLVCLPHSGSPLETNLLMIWQENAWQPEFLDVFMHLTRQGIDETQP